jgi:hypothetical protein
MAGNSVFDVAYFVFIFFVASIFDDAVSVLFSLIVPLLSI